MSRKEKVSRRPQGQIIVLFVLSLSAILLMVGVVIDGGYALAQSRSAQNASDFAALAGARIVAEWVDQDKVDGTDANVKAAIVASLHVNGAATPTFGAPNGPVYVDSGGNTVGWVGSGAIPTVTVGVRLSSSLSWRPFFLGIAGINSWTASAAATAKGGYAAGGPSGRVFPAGIAEAFFNDRSPCSGSATTNVKGRGVCDPQHLTPGNLNVPGGFGWLKFGCSGYGLGQDPPASDGGCANSKPFLQTEIDNGNSYGCCTQVGLSGSLDQIGSLPGNKVSADCPSVLNTVVTIAVWDKAGGSGSNAWYHIVGFTGFQITTCDGGKDIEGVWRQPFFSGPTTTTPGFAGQALAVQLVR